MPYKDLREYIDLLDEKGLLTRLDGVDWDGEVGEIERITSKAVLMDNFPGYPPGYRVLTGLRASTPEFFLATNWSSDKKGLELTRAWKEHLKEFKPVPPKWVKNGPIMENVFTGNNIDMLKFPVPKWHEDDGGRYIGTWAIEILKDMETGRINCGDYRVQVLDKAALAIYISEGKDGNIIRGKYFQQGKPCPIVAVFGLDSGLLIASQYMLTHEEGASELDLAGWLKGMPEEVIRGQFTGLPIPANAEIAIEGEMIPGDLQMEGPFGEGTGYSEPRMEPVIRVKTLYHRNDPIHTGTFPQAQSASKGRQPRFWGGAAATWIQMERAGIREIKGVASHSSGLIVVSIKNSYAGHAVQAGLVAAGCHSGAYHSRWVIVVDDDIDPTNLRDVMKATVARSDPRRAIQVVDNLWSSHKDLIDTTRSFIKAEYPLIPDKATYKSVAIVDACRPIERDPSWHRDAVPSKELENRVRKKWGKIVDED